jgi:hypothetical protein
VTRPVNLLFLLSLLPWTLIALVVLLFNDAPGPPSTSVQIFRALVFSYPIGVILSCFASSQAARRKNEPLAFRLSLMPFLWFLALALVYSASTRRP